MAARMRAWLMGRTAAQRRRQRQLGEHPWLVGLGAALVWMPLFALLAGISGLELVVLPLGGLVYGVGMALAVRWYGRRGAPAP